MPAKKPPRMVATVRISAGKREFVPGDAIEPSDLPPEVWEGLVRKGRIVEARSEEGEAAVELHDDGVVAP